MGRRVVDTSVVVKWAFEEPGSVAAARLQAAYAEGRLALMAPDVLVPEIANVVWKKCALRGEITGDEASRGLRLLLEGLPRLVASASLAEQAFHLATAHRVPVYDCLFVALALRERCPFVTADGSLRRRMGPAIGLLVAPEDDDAVE